jgi:hypothetical protein
MRPHRQALACSARKKFLYHFKAGPAGGRLRRPSSAGSTIDDGLRLADHADMRKLDHRIGTFAETHLFRYAVAVGLAAGVLAFLIGWLARREWIWFLFVMAAVVAGASSYASARWRRQERERLERRRQQPE